MQSSKRKPGTPAPYVEQPYTKQIDVIRLGVGSGSTAREEAGSSKQEGNVIEEQKEEEKEGEAEKSVQAAN